MDMNSFCNSLKTLYSKIKHFFFFFFPITGRRRSQVKHKRHRSHIKSRFLSPASCRFSTIPLVVLLLLSAICDVTGELNFYHKLLFIKKCLLSEILKKADLLNFILRGELSTRKIISLHEWKNIWKFWEIYENYLRRGQLRNSSIRRGRAKKILRNLWGVEVRKVKNWKFPI